MELSLEPAFRAGHATSTPKHARWGRGVTASIWSAKRPEHPATKRLQTGQALGQIGRIDPWVTTWQSTQMAERRNWTQSEVKEALALYLVTDFGRIHSRNPDVIGLAGRIGRTPSAVALKLTNLAALDDSLLQKGMANASATDRAVWAEFLANPSDIEVAYERQVASPAYELAEAPAAFDHLGGQTVRLVPQRRGQAMFREMVLTSYRSRCALTGAEDPRLLNASHILSWSEHPEHRMWPTNGICLNALHDRAFDRHMISFDDDWRMVVSSNLPTETRRLLEKGTDGQLRMPSRFQPDRSFMERHRARLYTQA